MSINNDIGSASLGAQSSRASSQGSEAHRQQQAAAQFRDDSNLQTAIKLLTTLEERPDGRTTAGGSGPPEDEKLLVLSGQKGKRHPLMELERGLVSRLFQINHVILKNHSVSTFAYHLIMLFEFLQILFFVFYKVEVLNEFQVNTVLDGQNSVLGTGGDVNHSQTPMSEADMEAALLGGSSNGIDATSSAASQRNNFFRIDFYFTFINFQMYTLQNSSADTFILLYAVLTAVFFIFLITLFVMSSQAFEDSKSEDIKESSKIILRILTFIMTLFLFLLQIPLITILLQGYLCEEDPLERYTLPEIKCDGTEHRVLTVFSTITLLVYVTFLILQQQLFTSNNFESRIPWSALERRIIMIKVLYKLVLSMCFVFDKSGSSRGLVGLICAVINSILVFKRYKSALIFKRSVYYATIFYEVITMWLQFTVAIYVFSESQITIISLALLCASGVFLSILMIFIQMKKRKVYVEEVHPDRFETPQQLELYFYHMYELIESSKPDDILIVQGMISNHIHYCTDPMCPCDTIVESMDDVKKYKKLKKKQEEEEELQLLQLKFERECAERTFLGGSTAGASFFDVQSFKSMMPQKPHAQPTVKNIESSNNNLNLLTIKGDQNSFTPTLGDIQQKQNAGLTVISAISGKSSQASPERKESSNGLLVPARTGSALQSFIRANSKRFNRPINLEKLDKENKPITAAGIAKTLNLLIDKDKGGGFGLGIGGAIGGGGGGSGFDWSQEQSSHDFKKFQRRRYKFLTILVRDAILKHPKNVDLRIINSFLQKMKLENEFKAIFELMNCDLCNPSLYDSFIIFRRKIEVEQGLIKAHYKNVQRIGQLDIIQVYNYEKYFLRFQMYEYLTVHAAQAFWRELLAKHIDASVLQERGQEIAKNYEAIQNIAQKLSLIYPNEIKFLYRYGTFLLHIINNEYDAVSFFERAINIHQNKISKKSTSTPVNEQTVFGENSAAGIVMIAANSASVGNVIHCNDEVESILGFQRKDVIGKNISAIIPLPIGRVHDRFIHRYFETAKPTVIDIRRNLFGRCKSGYIKAVELLVKVFPHLSDKIVFVGFCQRASRFTDMEPPKQDFEGNEHQYIITDQDGNITNVTEGLNDDMGLNAKFFQQSGDSIFDQMFNISRICPEIADHELQEALELEGVQLQFDTRCILSSLELESLSAEEILDVRSNLCQKTCYVQLKRLVLDPKFCTVNIYRIIIDPKNGLYGSSTNVAIAANGEGGQADGGGSSIKDTNSLEGAGTANMSVAASSMSSSSSNSFAFNRIIKDFKKALSERQTPSNLIMLNRLIIIILIATIVLTSVVFVIEKAQLGEMTKENTHQLESESRTIQIVQLASNVRSFINIANAEEFEQYEQGSLQTINRFEYLGRLIQSQANQLSSTHNFLTQQRSESDTGDNKKLSDFDYQPIDLYRLDSNNRVNLYQQPFRVALSTYLNNILMMNVTDKSAITLEDLLLRSAPNPNDSHIYNKTTLVQKSAFFLMVNGLRSIRTSSYEGTQFQKQSTQVNYSSTPFLAIMVVGIIISAFSVLSILYQVYVIEQNKAEILSLYALLNMKEIVKVYERCQQYMTNLNEGKIVGTTLEDQALIEKGKMGATLKESMGAGDPRDSIFGQLHQITPPGGNTLQDLKDRQEVLASMGEVGTIAGQQSGGGMNDDLNNSQISEEEKEQILYKRYVIQKKLHRLRENRKIGQGNSGGHHHFARSKQSGFNGGEIYAAMIKRTMEEIKDINDREDAARLKFYQKRQDDAKSKLKQIQEEPESSPNNEKGGEGQQQKNFKQSPGKKKHKKSGKIGKKGSSLDLGESFKNTNDRATKNGYSDEAKAEEEGSQDGKKIQRQKLHKDDSISDGEDDCGDKTERGKNSIILRKQNSDVSDQDNKKATGFELSHDEQEERKKLFFKTIKTKNWCSIALNVIVGMIFAGYFIQMYVLNNHFQVQLVSLQTSVPTFFDRYRDLMLSYAFLRERIINNNSLETYETDKFYGHDLDQMYRDLSTKVENDIKQLKNSYPSIIEPLVDLTKIIDSENFCKDIIGDMDIADAIKSFAQSSDPSVLNDATLKKTYQLLIVTVIQSNKAAKSGDIATLQYLFDRGVDLNKGDYDRRTPLHTAVRAGNMQSVQWLLKHGVRVDPLDRWGSTPLNYAFGNQDIANLLISRGASLGNPQPRLNLLATNFTDNDYKLFFAAAKNDAQTIAALLSNDVNVNIQDNDGRTALMVAASEGNIEAVKQIIAEGAELTMKDLRGNDALADAHREKRIVVVDYINTVISDTVIKHYCSEFGEGLFKKGAYQAIGSFHKRFADLLIKITLPIASYEDRLTFLKDNGIPNGFLQYNSTGIQTYFSSQELFFHRIIDKIIGLLEKTFSDSSTSFETIIQLIYLVFMIIQIIILFFLRAKLIYMMKEDIIQSRGILNLIPDDFFEQNRVTVEKLIKKLKN